MAATQISKVGQETLKRLLGQKMQLENQIQSYIQGMKDSMNLEGDGWVINLEEMVFHQEFQQSVNGDKPDVVGTTAGHTTRE